MAELLVSVTNVEEARKAYEANVDIIDVKNPFEGSLGAQFPWIIEEIHRGLPEHARLSVAIGDFPQLPGSAALAAYGAAKAGADFVKIGLKGPHNNEDVVEITEKVVRAVNNGSKGVKTVACAYGDYVRAGTIDPLSLPKAVAGVDLDYVMIDTALKDGRALTEFLSLSALREFIESARLYGFGVALAGSLGRKEIEEVKRLEPDIIGVRGAVCEGRDRKAGMISKELISELRNVLKSF